MKFEDLENDLNKQIRPAYLINGRESYLTTLALKTIEKRLNISLNEFNKVYFSDEFSGNMKDIVASCNVLPIMDSFRLIVVYDYMGKKSDSEKNAFLNYLKNPCASTCVVFFSTNKSEFFSSFEGKVENVECDKVSIQFLRNWVIGKLKGKGLDIDNDVLNKLFDYCNYSITKLNTEIEKLASIKVGASSKTITNEDVESYITKDIEYVIFDLSNAISNKDKDKAFMLTNAMLKNKEQPLSIVSLITNHFRRLFFISRSNFNDFELAEYLNIKEFAIKKYREQLRFFTQKELKKIFDLCVEIEFKLKSGMMEAKNAVSFLISSILS